MSFQDVCSDQDNAFAAGVSFDTHPLEENNSSCVEETQQQPVENVGSHPENMDRHSFVGKKTLKISSNLKKSLTLKLRGRYLCSWCPKIFSYQSILDLHVSRFHLNAFSITSSYKDKILETRSKVPQKKRSLLVSTKKKMRRNIALQRKKTQTLTLQNFCSFCSTSFRNRSSLNHHLNTRHKTPVHTHLFHCSMCEYKTDHQLTFDRHNLKHTISHFECNQCQMPFLRKENLLMHLKLKHSNTAKTPSQSVWHQCPHCQYNTSFKFLMNRHIFKHSLATHTCDICRMPFINEANIFYHMKSKHPSESEVITNGAEKVLHQCPFCPYSSHIYSEVSWHIRSQHCRERYKCKVCELFLPSEVALEEHNRQNHSHTNNVNGSDHFELCPKASLSTDDPADQCFYCPCCLNRLDTKSFLIHTDVSNYVCPTCNMAFSRQLLIEQNMQPFESKEPSFTPDESFSNFAESTEMHQLSDVQHMEEIYVPSEDLQNDIDVRSKDLDNSTRHVDQTDQIRSIDFIEINDDDDDDERIDVDANEQLHYPPVLHCNSSDKDANSDVCIEETHFPDKDNQCDPLMGSPHETLSTPGPSTSLDQSNSISKRGRYIKLVSDFDDFAERPFACALCYQRYSQFKQLAVHVKNHLTGTGGYDGVQTMASFSW